MMKKRILILLASITLLTFMFSGCVRHLSLEPVTDKQYNFSGFNQIEIDYTHEILSMGTEYNVPVELEVVKSDDYGVKISTNNNLFEFIQVSKSGDSLRIVLDKSKITTSEAVIKARVSMPELNGLKLSGGITRAKAFSSAPEFNAVVSGASRLNLDLQAGKAVLKISSSSDVTAGGRVSELTASVSSASTFNCDLEVEQVDLDISSSSDVILNGSSQKVKAGVFNASTLNLDISADEIDLTADSSSDIIGNTETVNLSASATNASTIKLEGSAQKALLEGRSSSDIICGDMVLTEASVTLSSASSGNLRVNDKIDVFLSGDSDLVYTGNPVMGKIDVDSGSSVTHN